MTDKKRISDDLAKIEKQIEKEITPIHKDVAKSDFKIDVARVKKIARQIRAFEENNGATFIAESRA